LRPSPFARFNTIMNAPEIEPQLHIPEAIVAWDPSEHPVVTCYVDWRVSGRGLHEAQTIVRKELHTHQAQLPTRGPARESFDADAARIEAYLADEADPAARGIAIFACHGRGLWWTATLGVPLATEVHAGEWPRLVPLAEATQEAARTLVVLADTNEVRLIRLDRTGPHEEPGPHRDQWKTVHHSTVGGWSQANYQRSVDVMVERFAQDVADTVAAQVTADQLDHLVLAGDEVITSPLRRALPPDLNDRIDAVEHIDIRAGIDDVVGRIWPAVQQRASADRERDLKRLLELAGAGRAITEPADLRTQLAAGRVDTLAFDPERLEDDAAELLLREALTHRSRVVIARGDAALTEAGGAVASLRGSG